MSKIVAYCGLVCSSCPTFFATQNDDDDARKKIAAFYSGKFGFTLKPEDINCDGCLAEPEKQIGYCRICKIRKCCREKGLDNCAICDDQPCEKLKALHDLSNSAKVCFENLLKEVRLFA